ncbi:hypothetical protein AK830_g8626 [Neonectria ditissima]|uniref:Uncharacterized protein n=1 Tax=Neonectria ditissima TaxID=78410 RepID=A0A0P7BAW3_9HYPO|nr:hypothetical protein AK830_g8626 [Neonectria ditissima]
MTPDVFSESRPILMVPIDMWKYSGSSLGLVVFPQNTWNRTNSDLTPPSNVVACSVDARWSEAKTVMEVRKSTALMHEFHLGRVRNLVGTELLLQEFPRNPGYARYIPSDDRMPVIRMTPSWYDGLSPMFPDAPSILPYLPAIGTKQTTGEVLMSLVYTWWGTHGSSRCGLIDNYNASRFLEAWDYGSWDVDNEKLARAMVRQGAPVETFPEPFILKSGNVTRMEMKAIYSGYVMSATGWFDYLSIIALLLHALIALVHAVLVVFYGKMSGAWDTILELVALAQMSTPPPEPLLANASAGTRSFKTVRIVAWVEAPRAGAASPAELGGELQMRFSQQTDQRDPSLKPTIGSVYGSTA